MLIYLVLSKPTVLQFPRTRNNMKRNCAAFSLRRQLLHKVLMHCLIMRKFGPADEKEDGLIDKPQWPDNHVADMLNAMC